MKEKPPIPDGPCWFPGCKNPGKATRQNTAYVDDLNNWGVYCDECQKYVDKCWDEQWQEYYGGRL